MLQPDKLKIRSLDNAADTSSVIPKADRGQLMSDKGVKMFKAGSTREQVAAYDAKQDAKARTITSTGTKTRGSSQGLASKTDYTPVTTEVYDRFGNLKRK
jgi:hypothetical protein